METPTSSDVPALVILVPFAAALLWLLVSMIRERELPILPALLVICIAVAGIAAFEPPHVDQWAKFKQEHSCRIVAKRDGQSSSGVGVGVTNGLSLGVFSGSTSPQTAYVCDDGVTYWKNE